MTHLINIIKKLVLLLLFHFTPREIKQENLTDLPKKIQLLNGRAKTENLVTSLQIPGSS